MALSITIDSGGTYTYYTLSGWVGDNVPTVTYISGVNGQSVKLMNFDGYSYTAEQISGMAAMISGVYEDTGYDGGGES